MKTILFSMVLLLSFTNVVFGQFGIDLGAIIPLRNTDSLSGNVYRGGYGGIKYNFYSVNGFADFGFGLDVDYVIRSSSMHYVLPSGKTAYRTRRVDYIDFSLFSQVVFPTPIFRPYLEIQPVFGTVVSANNDSTYERYSNSVGEYEQWTGGQFTKDQSAYYIQFGIGIGGGIYLPADKYGFRIGIGASYFLNFLDLDKGDNNNSPLSNLHFTATIEFYPKLNQTDIPLLVRNGDIAALRKHAHENHNINIILDDGNYSIHVAVQSNNYQMAQLLLDEGADPNVTNKEGKSSFLYAVSDSMIELLLRFKADIQSTDSKGNTLLHLLCSLADDKGIESATRVLLERGANVGIKNKKLQTSLHLAVASGNISAVSELIYNRSQIDAQDEIGSTPLFYAVDNGKLDVILLLLNNSASVNLSNNKGDTPLLRSVIARRMEIGEQSQSIEIMKALLNSGANPNFKNSKCGSLPVEVVCCNDTTMLGIFIQYGMDINAKDSLNSTLLQVACQHGYRGIARYLLDRGSSTNDYSVCVSDSIRVAELAAKEKENMGSYFPLRKGNIWKYEFTSYFGMRKSTNTVIRTIDEGNDKERFVQIEKWIGGVLDGYRELTQITVDSSVGYYMSVFTQVIEPVNLEPKIKQTKLFPLIPVVGKVWKDKLADGSLCKYTIVSKSEYYIYNTLYKDVYCVEIEKEGGDLHKQYWAPGVGLVKEVSLNERNDIVPEQIMELIYHNF